jgi:enoyl-CoA hydratase/carnithine racemase
MTATARLIRHDDVGVIELDNPPVNALALGLRVGLEASLEAALGDPSIVAIVLAGAGRMFCGGADLREFNTPAAAQPPFTGELRTRILALYEEIQANLEAAYSRAGQILDTVFGAEDMTAALTAHLGELDDVFDILLDGQRTMADRAGDDVTVKRLTEIIALTAHVKDAALTPVDRAVQALLASENATRYIRENIGDITGGVVKRLNEIAEEYTTKGKTDEADKVRRIAREAGAMLF